MKSAVRQRLTLGLASIMLMPMCGASPAVAQDEPTTIYKETFQYCSGSIGKDAAAEVGWIGIKSGLPQGKFSNLKVFSYGSTVIGGAVNSGPKGKSEGYSFWFRPMYGLSIITAEMGFDVSLLSKYPSRVAYEQRLSGIDVAGIPNQTQLLFLIDDSWYISSTAARQNKPGVWEPVNVDPSELRYGVVPYVKGLGPELPVSYGESLPLTGRVKAFGVFMQEVNGRVRLDNFSISTTGPVPASISTAVQATSVEGCPATSPDRGAGGNPTPTPSPDDNDGGTDQQNPDGPKPPGTNPDTTAATFCPTREQGAGLRVRISRAARQAFVTVGATRGRVALRDRAIANVYATRLMPIGALVNVRVGDYNSRRGTIKLSLRRSRPAVSIRLPLSARKAVGAYIANLGTGVTSTSPLFGSVASNGRVMNLKKAACSRELQSLVGARIRAARLPANGVLIR